VLAFERCFRWGGFHVVDTHFVYALFEVYLTQSKQNTFCSHHCSGTCALRLVSVSAPSVLIM
jgi:hypothetical protein